MPLIPPIPNKALTLESQLTPDTIFFRQVLQKLLGLYSSKKHQLCGGSPRIIDSLRQSPDSLGNFAPLTNFLQRSAFCSIFQFFAPHLFFNLAVWGMRRLNNILNEVKSVIESKDPQHFRSSKTAFLDEILRKHGARDETLEVSANLELLDALAFGFADMYQEFRGKLIFAEDVLKKQFEEMGILERAEARESLRKHRKLQELKETRARPQKSRFEQMARDMGVFFEADLGDDVEEAPLQEGELQTLKAFLQRQGVSSGYLKSVQQFGKNELKAETEADSKYNKQETEFGRFFDS